MDNFYNEDFRRSLEQMTNSHNKLVETILQPYKVATAATISPALHSIQNAVRDSLFQYYNILEDSIRTSMPSEQLKNITDTAAQIQIEYLQNTIDAIQFNIPNIETLGLHQISETVSILANQIQRYPFLDIADFPADIEIKLDQVVEKTKALDTENDSTEYELINDKSVDFISRLTLFISILSLILTAHSNYLQIGMSTLF